MWQLQVSPDLYRGKISYYQYLLSEVGEWNAPVLFLGWDKSNQALLQQQDNKDGWHSFFWARASGLIGWELSLHPLCLQLAASVLATSTDKWSWEGPARPWEARG